MKYLNGFKWEMLGEQVGELNRLLPRTAQLIPTAYEKQAHQARLRNEIARSKSEQSEYLRNVELARVLKKRKTKKTEEGEGDTATSTNPSSGKDDAKKARRDYKQRKTIGGGAIDRGMEGVLGSVFG